MRGLCGRIWKLRSGVRDVVHFDSGFCGELQSQAEGGYVIYYKESGWALALIHL